MYIELFLLDNLLMNLLTVRLAAAFISVRPPLYRQLAVCAASAGYAALAAYLCPALAGLWVRPPLLIFMALALPVKRPRGLLGASAAVLFASLIVGGSSLCIALVFGGGIENGSISGGIPLRAAALSAAAAAFMPRAVRRALARRLPEGMLVGLAVEHNGIERRFTALVDTGNGLFEPLTGLPVIVVSCRAFARYARIPVGVSTAAGSGMLYAFRPRRITVDGVPVNALVAVTGAKMRCEALAPPSVCPGQIIGIGKTE